MTPRSLGCESSSNSLMTHVHCQVKFTLPHLQSKKTQLRRKRHSQTQGENERRQTLPLLVQNEKGRRVSEDPHHLQLNADPCRIPPTIEITPPSNIGYRLPILSTTKGENGAATKEPREYMATMRPNEVE